MIKKRITPLMDAEKADYIEKGIVVVVNLYELNINEDISYKEKDLEGKALEEFYSLYRAIYYAYYHQCPLEIYDYGNDAVYYAQFFNSDNSAVFTSHSGANIIISLDLSYTGGGETPLTALDVHNTAENIATEDNVKTLFGDKSIIGQGNIDLYRHNLEIGNGTATVYVTIYSSNNLVCDSLQDLTTVLKPTNLTGKYGWGTGYMTYANGVWKMTVSGEALSNVTVIHDYVSAI